MIFDELHTGFRWYDSLDKQTRFKEYCSALCDYGLMSPCNDILPFQIRTDSFSAPTSWLLKYLDGEQLVPTVTPAVDPASKTWGITSSTGMSNFQLFNTTSGKTIGNTQWNTDLDTTLAALAVSVNTATQDGALINGSYPFITSSLGFAASYDSGTNIFTLTPPIGSGATYNGITFFMAVNATTVFVGGIQIATFSGGVDAVTTWSLSDTIDLEDCLPFINQYTIGAFDYLQYNGGDLTGCMGVAMECGKWYSQISDGTHTVFSEVFEVLPLTDIDFAQSKLPNFSAWRWYDSKAKQTRYKEYCSAACDFYLLTGNDKLLPFQISNPDGGVPIIQSWKLISIDEDCEYDLPIADLAIVQTVSHGYRIIYTGDLISLPCGKFYSVINDNIEVWYSELIRITDEIVIAEEYYILLETGSKMLQENLDGLLLE